MEVIPADCAHPAYRMLLARLYNAEVKVTVLEDVFKLDHKSIRGWGLALDSGDLDALQRMVFGAPGKITPAIKAFIAQRWPELRAQHCRNHRAVLQDEIKTYFRVSLSGESLRMMMNQITGEKDAAEARAWKRTWWRTCTSRQRWAGSSARCSVRSMPAPLRYPTAVAASCRCA